MNQVLPINKYIRISCKKFTTMLLQTKRAIMLALALLLQLYKMARLRKAIRINRKFIDIVKGLNLLCVQDIKEKLSFGVHKIGDFVLGHGGITAAEDLRSLLKPERAVAYSELMMDKVLQIGDRTNTITKKIRTLHPSYLTLSCYGDKINIYETSLTSMLPSMLTKVINTGKETICNLGWFLNLFINSPTRTISSIFSERFIPNDHYNVVLGKISKSPGGQVYMRKPLAIGPSKQAIIQHFIENVVNKEISFYFYAFLVAVTLGFIGHSLYKNPEIRKLFNKNNGYTQAFEKIQRIFVKSRYCLSCKKKLTSIIRIPCAHMSICQQCQQRSIPASKCSECDKKIKQNVYIYPS